MNVAEGLQDEDWKVGSGASRLIRRDDSFSIVRALHSLGHDFFSVIVTVSLVHTLVLRRFSL